MSGEDVAAELRHRPVPEFEHTASTMPPPLASARVPIVTTAGLRIDGVRNWAPGSGRRGA